MKNKIPEIPARYYARMVDVVQKLDVDVFTLLQVAQIDANTLHGTDTLLSIVQVEALIAEMLRLSKKSDLAIEVGRALKLTSHSSVGFALLTSPSMSYALHLLARYFRLITPLFSMQYALSHERVDLLFRPILPMSNSCVAFHLEVMAVAIHWDLSEMLQQRLPRYDLYLSLTRPAHAARYSELAEARCHFLWESAPCLRMSFPAEFMQQPLPFADPSALQMAERQCHELVKKVIIGNRVADWVLMMLRESDDGMPSLAELAQTLNLSTRTLDRYLKKQEVSFRVLQQQVIQEKSLKMLADNQLTITQIAYELGYSNTANFTRAFKQVMCMNPSDYRRHLMRG
jgi:AraC-like DNA-binding protein